MTKRKTAQGQLPLFSDEQLGMNIGEERNGYKLVRNSLGRIQRINIKTRRTKDEYVALAVAIWGDQYDYSESQYLGGKQPITIRCRKHNHYFTVTMAQNHIKNPAGRVPPTGCPLCVEEKLGWKTYRGPHHFRTPEERRRDEEEKQRRKAERERRLKQGLVHTKAEQERQRQQREQAERDYMTKYGAKSMPEARFCERVQQQYGYDTSLVNYTDKDHRVSLICPYHGLFEITPRTLFIRERGKEPHGCWTCCGLTDPRDKRKLTTTEIYRQLEHKYRSDGLVFQHHRKLKPSTKLTATCRKHGDITHDVRWWLDGKGCDYCNGKFYPPDFLRLAHAAQGDDYQYRGYETVQTRSDLVDVHCPNPDHEWHPMRVDLILQGCRCRECAGRHQPVEKRCQDWIRKSDEKYRGEYDYSEAPADYLNNDSKVWLTHKPCGTRFQVTPDTHLRNVNGGCPTCNAIYLESEGERIIRLWLEDHHIDHRPQVQLPNEDPALPLEYLVCDFWIDDYQRRPLIIEYNGQQHYQYSKHYHEGRRRNFKVQQQRDRYLRRYCSDNLIQLLEIPYTYFDQLHDILEQVFVRGQWPDLQQPSL